jgi:hypothetical protein
MDNSKEDHLYLIRQGKGESYFPLFVGTIKYLP